MYNLIKYTSKFNRKLENYQDLTFHTKREVLQKSENQKYLFNELSWLSRNFRENIEKHDNLIHYSVEYFEEK